MAIPLNCTCGDICVNTTGWWRNNSFFNVSGTPIQAAVNNANAGETICVKDGTYNENVDVDKRLAIRSENRSALTTVEAASTGDYVFQVTADYVNISGFKMIGATDNGKAGIYLDRNDHCNISDNNASSNNFGIYLQASCNNTITNNNASNNTNYDFYSHQNSHNNTVKDFTISSFPTTISFTYDNGIGIKGVTDSGIRPCGKGEHQQIRECNECYCALVNFPEREL